MGLFSSHGPMNVIVIAKRPRNSSLCIKNYFIRGESLEYSVGLSTFL